MLRPAHPFSIFGDKISFIWRVFGLVILLPYNTIHKIKENALVEFLGKLKQSKFFFFKFWGWHLFVTCWRGQQSMFKKFKLYKIYFWRMKSLPMYRSFRAIAILRLTATSTLDGGYIRVDTLVLLQLSKHHCEYCRSFPSNSIILFFIKETKYL